MLFVRCDWYGTGDSHTVRPVLRRRMDVRPRMTLLSRLWKEEEGQDLTEYALLLVLVVLAVLAALASFGSAISRAFSSAAVNVTT